MRALLHLALHALVPLGVARRFAPAPWWRAFLIMMATMIVDLDHLLANPLYDPDRCSLGFHPLHTAAPIAIYAVLALLPRTRWVGVGLLIHMALDGVDCLAMQCLG